MVVFGIRCTLLFKTSRVLPAFMLHSIVLQETHSVSCVYLLLAMKYVGKCATLIKTTITTAANCKHQGRAELVLNNTLPFVWFTLGMAHIADVPLEGPSP